MAEQYVFDDDAAPEGENHNSIQLGGDPDVLFRLQRDVAAAKPLTTQYAETDEACMVLVNFMRSLKELDIKRNREDPDTVKEVLRLITALPLWLKEDVRRELRIKNTGDAKVKAFSSIQTRDLARHLRHERKRLADKLECKINDSKMALALTVALPALPAQQAVHEGRFMEEEVRAPIENMQDQLLHIPTGPPQQPQQVNVPLAPFTANENGEESALAAMYKVPEGLVCPEPFDGALALAKQECKWMLVNIQQGDEFTSHSLNLVWQDEVIGDMLTASFVFWQRNRQSPEGEQFANLYKLFDFPIVCVLDPRTGRNLKSWPGKKFADVYMAAEILTEFLDAKGDRPEMPVRKDSLQAPSKDASPAGGPALPPRATAPATVGPPSLPTRPAAAPPPA